ncbi:hypothetical protein F5Y15DRAFT_412613 [Xylariaceae sp. FL0016]|nr:hypothetical protein F5Y15DRAFT_412613 [Xylariaceae sp. FL0016]
MRLPQLLVVFALSSVERAVASSSTLPSTAPACGLQCIVQYTTPSTCSLTDVACICTNVPLLTEITQCVTANCSVVEQLETTRYSKGMCGVEPEDNTAMVAAVPMVFGSLAVVVFGLRIYSKCYVGLRGWGADDWAMTAAVAFTIPLMVLSVPLSEAGLGRDIWNLSRGEVTRVLYLYFWDELVYFPATAFTKISILLFYLSIFKSSIRWIRPAAWSLIGLNVGYMVAFDLVSIFQCTPVPGAWLHWDGEYDAVCRNINAQAWASAAINIVLDVTTLLLPMPALWKLSMSTAKKVQVMLMFGLGGFVTIVSILRLHTILEFGSSANITQDYVAIGVWTTIEVPVGVICACLPSIRTLLKEFMPSVFGSTQASRSGYLERSVPVVSDQVWAIRGSNNNPKAAYADPKDYHWSDRSSSVELNHIHAHRDMV